MILAPLLLLLGLTTEANYGLPDFVSAHPHARVEDWAPRQAEIDTALADPARLKATRLVFVGDSITEYWLRGDNPAVPGQKYGQAIWQESFAQPGSDNYALNLGVTGDHTEHVLQRILPKAEGGLGELDSPQLDPDVIVLMIGANNIWAPSRLAADNVFVGIRAVLVALHERKPKSKIVLLSLLPVSNEAMNKTVVRAVNLRLHELAASAPYVRYTSYFDLYAAYADAKGVQEPRYFVDGLHPNEAGYRLWRFHLVPFLKSVRGKKR